MGRQVRKMGRQVKVPIISAISGAVITTFVIQMLIPAILKWLRPPPPPPASVTITSPESGSRIPRHVIVRGTASHIPKDKELWILVEAGGHYFPQPGPVYVVDDGTWSAEAWVGSDEAEDIGRHFMLIAALADKAGSAAIHANLKPQDFKPLDPLTGIQVMNGAEVERRP